LGEVLTTPPRETQKGYVIFKCIMLLLETKQSRDKILPHLHLQGGVFLGEASCTKERKRNILLGTWNVRSLYGEGSLRAEDGSSGSGKGLWGLDGVGSG
jgi:hypothetical protein